VIDAERLNESTFHALDGKTTFPNIVFSPDSFNMMSGSIGMKINIVDRLLAQLNVLFALDQHGVRDKVTPLFGFQYTF
jgi:hypothetical protein